MLRWPAGQTRNTAGRRCVSGCDSNECNEGVPLHLCNAAVACRGGLQENRACNSCVSYVVSIECKEGVPLHLCDAAVACSGGIEGTEHAEDVSV
jgi:sulfur relay (sulfurtransferase) complex TusBCD TusD component (DsrE family)